MLQRTKNNQATRYIWGVGLLYEVDESGNATYYHYDNVGSTIALSDGAQAVIERIEYAPYGMQSYRQRTAGYEGAFLDTPFLWTGFYGNQTDSNGLVYLRNRYYNPLISRFVNSDPARDGWNWYAYAGGNPMAFVDPSGLGLSSALDAVQTGLSFLGLVPVVGNVFDVVNAGISTARGVASYASGNYSRSAGYFADAGLNAAAALPGIGQAVADSKFAGVGIGAIGAIRTTGRLAKYDVGVYNMLRRSAGVGLDAHHVGQSAAMGKFIQGYDAATAPSILVPNVGHTIRGPNGIVSRSTNGFTSARDVIARDLRELRRVYPDIPNSKLQELIQLNKDLYPAVRK